MTEKPHEEINPERERQGVLWGVLRAAGRFLERVATPWYENVERGFNMIGIKSNETHEQPTPSDQQP